MMRQRPPGLSEQSSSCASPTRRLKIRRLPHGRRRFSTPRHSSPGRGVACLGLLLCCEVGVGTSASPRAGGGGTSLCSCGGPAHWLRLVRGGAAHRFARAGGRHIGFASCGGRAALRVRSCGVAWAHRFARAGGAFASCEEGAALRIRLCGGRGLEFEGDLGGFYVALVFVGDLCVLALALRSDCGCDDVVASALTGPVTDAIGRVFCWEALGWC